MDQTNKGMQASITTPIIFHHFSIIYHHSSIINNMQLSQQKDI